MNGKVIGAIFRRNFIGYFSNPTGYVFICIFVLLSTVAAFFPNEFFNANLANLDQLNNYIAYILLLFVPAITMSVWAEERRQGTDELLLTMPADDLDVVFGKYLAVVAIYTVSLMFSLVSTLGVLYTLGSPDVGLFLTNYFGYWLMGLSMLSIGMVASFLTSNLTVAFILGLLLNAPLVAFFLAGDYTSNTGVAGPLKEWSMQGQFRDFGRGVISFSSIVYYFAVVAVMLYVCMVLIGRRHWAGRSGKSMFAHYLVRTLSLGVAAVAAVMVLRTLPLHADATSERLSSVSPGTRSVIAALDPKRPVTIEAYVSPSVPEEFVAQRTNLLSFLREFERLAGRGVIEVRIHEVEPMTDEAKRAEQQFGIRPRRVIGRDRGAFRDQEVFLGVAFVSGLEKVIVPFFDRNVPVEYELARNIWTVNHKQRKTIGVVRTDADLFSGFDMSSGMPSQRSEQQIIAELKKQYEVIQVDPSSPITAQYDVLMCVQPSSLSPQQLPNFVDAVRSGQKTVIFEDPRPAMFQAVVGTGEQKRPRQQMMMMGGGQPPEPKGDINQLWRLLGVELKTMKARTNPFNPLGGAAEPLVVGQQYNPHKKIQNLSNVPEQFLFIDRSVPRPSDQSPFNDEDQITANLQEIMLPFAGALTKINGASTTFTPLVTTGNRTGAIPSSLLQGARIEQLGLQSRATGEVYVVAARVGGKVEAAKVANVPMADEGSPEKAKSDASSNESSSEKASSEKSSAQKSGVEKSAAAKSTAKSNELDVVVIADIDLLHDTFFELRNQQAQTESDIAFNFDNITFVLNTIDVMAGEERFVEIRARERPTHRPLSAVDEQVENVRQGASTMEDELKEEVTREKEKLEQSRADSRDAFRKRIDELKKANASAREIRDAEIAVQLQEQIEERRFATSLEKINQKYETGVKDKNREVLLGMRQIQDSYKLKALLIPPIFPLLIGLGVFFSRRAREREGVNRARLK